jgi:hypothetical protein
VVTVDARVRVAPAEPAPPLGALPAIADAY